MSGPLRVAYLLEQCWHRVPGGTATSVVGLGRALVDDGGVDLVGVSARHRDQPPAPFAPPVATVSMPLPRLALYEAWHRLRRPPVQTATGPVDVVHATGGVVPPRTAPLVVTVHDLAFLHHPEHFTPRGVRFMRRGFALAAAEADAVVCPSEASADDCDAAGVPARVVPWGVDLPDADAAAAGAASVRVRYGLPGRYVLGVGTIEPRKNLPSLLAAMRCLPPDVGLVLAGPAGWNTDLRPALAGIESRVRQVGFVPAADLAGLYAGAAVFCYPSLLEGFGLPVLEAMAHGAPVVTSAGTATEEVAGDAGVLVDPRSTSSIVDGLRAVLDSPAHAAELGRRGRERAATFSWARSAAAMRAVYEEVR